jgi:5-methyltetrahydrofolate--homocysteine methyltransferase
MDRDTRVRLLRDLIASRVIVLDGGMGTSIQDLNLTADDFGGPEYEGCNEFLNITAPEAIKGIHRSFLEAGSDVIETNSFGSTPLVLAEYGLGDRALEISEAAARIARECADEYGTDEAPRFVAGSMGPTTKAISVTGGVTWDDLAEHYRVQAVGLINGGADLLLMETTQDSLNVKAALEGIDRAIVDTGFAIPVAVQATIETMGTTLGGQDIEAFYDSVAHRDLLWMGMNCATGPEFMRDHIRTLAGIARFPIAAIPNAGLPDENGHYHETPEMISRTIGSFVDEGWVNVIGGCCGTTGEHIRHIVAAAQGKQPHATTTRDDTAVSGLETLVISDEKRPVIVGERTNVLGSRLFKRLIKEGKIEEAAEIGRTQVRNGAHVLDICLQDPDRDEASDMIAFLERLTRKVKAPLVIDTTDPVVLEEALKRTPGKCIINSINLEDGEARFEVVVPIARRYGAALIVGCIDDDPDQAQAITRERKLEVAQRSYDLLTTKYGVPPEDIIFDPLVFPVGTGDENYTGSGVETIEGVRLIKQAMPATKTVLGISNVSFGLPPAGREVLNSVFLYHCVQAGLDMAIVNSERMMRYASIPLEERKLTEDLIWWQGETPIADFAAHFRERKVEKTAGRDMSLPPAERISANIIEGSKEGLFDDLDVMLKGMAALDIVNGPLMAGMDEVGRLFGNNELIVAEVLESAEAMKAAVAHLEPHMEAGETAVRGTILLATVKGDVHDIGKNLVDIILSNNGYKVINLGIKILPQQLIDAHNEFKPDIIGLSGLLVKSAQMMVDSVRDLKTAGISCPVLVGGAALTSRFTRLRIAPEYDGLVAYARDAMSGLSLAGNIVDEAQRTALAASLAEETAALLEADAAQKAAPAPTSPAPTSSHIVAVVEPPRPPDLNNHVLEDFDLTELFPYINPQMLYVRHLGYRGRFTENLAAGEQKAVDLHRKVREIETIMLERSDIRAGAIYRFYRAASDGNDLVILSPDGKGEQQRFHFGRQSQGNFLCLADYLQPIASGTPDYVGSFVTSVGPGVRALADQWTKDGDYLASHILQSLAIEGAEAFAELLHQRMRAMWGFADSPATQAMDLFKAKYQGKRYSFGYPACPRLEDQAGLWELLHPDQHIGVQLTEEFMMDPEGSVSALVFHHPHASYFNLSPADADALEISLAPQA